MAPEKTVSATRSMGTRLGKLKSAVADLENILNELKLKPSILEVEASYVQRLEQAVVKRFGSIDDKWEELEDEDNFADEAEREKCQSDYDEAKNIHKAIMKASTQVLSQPCYSVYYYRYSKWTVQDSRHSQTQVSSQRRNDA